MSDCSMNISAPNLVNICVDSYKNGTLIARIYHKYSKKPICINGINDLLIKMEHFMDGLDYPQAWLKKRSFEKQKENVQRTDTEYEKVWKEEELMAEKGDEATFVVHIQYRQNATWQGEVLWAEGRRKVHFRSALELLKLMDGALNLPDEGTGEFMIEE